MFRNMERNTYSAVVWSSHGNLDIEFGPVHVFTEHPHFIKKICGQGFNIIVSLQLANNLIPCLGSDGVMPNAFRASSFLSLSK